MASGFSSGHPLQADCTGSRAVKAPKTDVNASASASALDIWNLLLVDPVDPSVAHLTPLFRDPLTNTPLRYDTINSCIKSLMESVCENPAEFSTHSMRIGGATALLARTRLSFAPWSAGPRTCTGSTSAPVSTFEQCCEWTRRVGTQRFLISPACPFDEVDDY
jgi:hypothetical protein